MFGGESESGSLGMSRASGTRFITTNSFLPIWENFAVTGRKKKEKKRKEKKRKEKRKGDGNVGNKENMFSKSRVVWPILICKPGKYLLHVYICAHMYVHVCVHVCMCT